jgi:phage anti-repressor protein
MYELVKVQEQGAQQTVNARDLWEFLEIKRQFADWVRDQIERGKFIEGRDFLVFHKKVKNSSGGRPAEEYSLTLRTAEHIAMMSQGKKAEQVRDYFCEVERLYRENYITNQIGKVVRRELTDALKDSGLNDQMHGWGYKTFTDLIYKLILGINAKQYREMFSLPKDADVRKYLNEYQRQEVARLESAAKGLIGIGMTYEEIKKILEEKFLSKPKLLTAK